MAQSPFSSNGNYRIDVDAAVQSQNRAGNYSIIYWRIYVVKSNAYGHMATTNMGNHGNAQSSVGQVWGNGNMAYEFRNGSSNGSFLIADGTFRVNHNGVGEASYYFSASLTYYALGSASASTGWRNLPRLATEPPRPRPVAFHNVRQTEVTYQFTSNGDGGTPVREWQIGYGTNPNGPQYYTGSNGRTVLGALSPATTWYVWSRGRNDIGWSDWSTRSSVVTKAGALIKIGKNWVKAVPFVKTSSGWKIAQPLIKVNGKWVETD